MRSQWRAEEAELEEVGLPSQQKYVVNEKVCILADQLLNEIMVVRRCPDFGLKTSKK